MTGLTHLDRKGKARMVDVSGKTFAEREAVARGAVTMKRETLSLIRKNRLAKGDVLGIARIAGIMAAKKTSELIPMCHPLNLASVTINFGFDTRRNRIDIESRVKVTAQTGVEMEAMTAVAVAALTIYDMCKSVEREMTICEILLVEKSGGKSGHFKR
jgi:cyclic pyranopterin phosphate synthase